MSFNFLNYIFIILCSTSKKRWLLKELIENDINYKSFLFFIILPKDDGEFLDYLLPVDFFKIKSCFFNEGFGSQDIQLIHEKKITRDNVNFFIEFIKYMAINDEFGFELNDDNNVKTLIVYYKFNNDILLNLSSDEHSLNEMKNFVIDFIHSDFKIGKRAFEIIKNDFILNYLSGFSIDFNDYEMELMKNGEDEFTVYFENKHSLKKIIINKAKINEKTGLVSFAGEGLGFLLY